MTGAPKIKLSTRMKEPIAVEEGEDLVLKVPYSGQPKPKVLPRVFSGPPKIKDPSLLKEPIVVDEGEDLVMKVPYSGRPKPKV